MTLIEQLNNSDLRFYFDRNFKIVDLLGPDDGVSLTVSGFPRLVEEFDDSTLLEVIGLQESDLIRF